MKSASCKAIAACLPFVLALQAAAVAQPLPADARQEVALPPVMRAHLLSNMRGHLESIDRILAELAGERYAQAGRLAEDGLGLESLRAHDAAHMAPFFPQGMQAAGLAMHRAASRFALAAADADVDRSYASLVRLNSALGEVTAACTGCHANYRLAPAAQ